ncbi:hypothetical protein ACJX0J_007611 [Zea mays]
MDSYKDGIFPTGISEFLLLSFFLSIEETGTIQFNILFIWLEFVLSKKRGWDPLIVNFYTELENYIGQDLGKIYKRIIEIFLKKINSLFIFYSKILPKIQFHFSMGFYNKSLDSELGTHVTVEKMELNPFMLTITSISNLSFGFLVF